MTRPLNTNTTPEQEKHNLKRLRTYKPVNTQGSETLPAKVISVNPAPPKLSVEPTATPEEIKEFLAPFRTWTLQNRVNIVITDMAVDLVPYAEWDYKPGKQQ